MSCRRNAGAALQRDQRWNWRRITFVFCFRYAVLGTSCGDIIGPSFERTSEEDWMGPSLRLSTSPVLPWFENMTYLT